MSCTQSDEIMKRITDTLANEDIQCTFDDEGTAYFSMSFPFEIKILLFTIRKISAAEVQIQIAFPIGPHFMDENRFHETEKLIKYINESDQQLSKNKRLTLIENRINFESAFNQSLTEEDVKNILYYYPGYLWLKYGYALIDVITSSTASVALKKNKQRLQDALEGLELFS